MLSVEDTKLETLDGCFPHQAEDKEARSFSVIVPKGWGSRSTVFENHPPWDNIGILYSPLASFGCTEMGLAPESHLGPWAWTVLCWTLGQVRAHLPSCKNPRPCPVDEVKIPTWPTAPWSLSNRPSCPSIANGDVNTYRTQIVGFKKNWQGKNLILSKEQMLIGEPYPCSTTWR